MRTSTPTQNDNPSRLHHRPFHATSIDSPLQNQMEGRRTSPQDPPLLFLPATTYNGEKPTKARYLSVSTQVPSLSVPPNIQNEHSPNPDDFYRQHQEQYLVSGNGVLSQNSLVVQDVQRGVAESAHVQGTGASSNDDFANPPRTRPPSRRQSTTQFTPSKLYESSKSSPALHTQLMNRKLSIKDLVARFDSSNQANVPPLPSNLPSSVTSQTLSQTQSVNRHRMPSSSFSAGTGVTNLTNNSISSYLAQAPFSQVPTVTGPSRPPLFGEIAPDFTGPSMVGYGITNPRRRGGSTGSPMHSPNPMFPQSDVDKDEMLSPVSPTAWYKNSAGFTKGNNGHPPSAIPRPGIHRRANSDFSSTWNAMSSPVSYGHVGNGSARPGTKDGAASAKRSSQSRIPVSNRRTSVTSDSGYSTPSSRAGSKLAKYSTATPTSVHEPNTTPKHSSKQLSPKHISQTPMRIKSPGSREYTSSIPISQKSPSLRANIIVPPPKISPPLRSSRPRLPVSAASTTASRAKMAEKYNSMQKQNQERRTMTRKPARPPELNDVDLQARRLKITQALTRSRQGAELRAERPSQRGSGSTSRSNSEISPRDQQSSDVLLGRAVSQPPVLIVEKATLSVNDLLATVTEPEPESPNLTLPGSFPVEPATGPVSDLGENVESPTLGHTPMRTGPPLLQTYLQNLQPNAEPNSAVTADTVETEGTVIDVEPQSEFTRPKPPADTVLSQIMRMRSPSHSSHSTSHSSSDEDDHHTHDQVDQESIHIILQKTSYLDEADPFERVELTPGKSTQAGALWGNHGEKRQSWSSSIQDVASDDEIKSEERVESIGKSQTTPRTRPEESQSGVRRRELDRNPWQDIEPETLRSTMASDAYTIVNFVLQQHSTSGLVSEEVADQIYNRLLSQSPKLADDGTLDSQKIEELCKEALEEFNAQHNTGDDFDEAGDFDGDTSEPGTGVITAQAQLPLSSEQRSETNAMRTHGPSAWPTKPSFLSHRQKASLDSAEDWAETSPSVSSWMRFATSPTDEDLANHAIPQSKELNQSDQEFEDNLNRIPASSGPSIARSTSDAHPFHAGPEHGIPRPPSKSPPLPPLPHVPFAPRPRNEFPYTSIVGAADNSQDAVAPPQVPHRVASLSQLSTRPQENVPWNHHTTVEYVSDGRVSLERPSMDTTSSSSSPSPEDRRLKQRRHVLKELVDTEARFEKDMKVLSDIYRETAYPSLSYEDIKTLFGNADQILKFVTEFLVNMKQAAKPTYVIDRSDRFQSAKNRGDQDGRVSQLSHSSKSKSDSASIQQSYIVDSDKDKQTRVGAVFEQWISRMGAVYSEYIRNHDAANKKLQSVQQNFGVQQWLKECKENSADLTSAWDLDSLLVKPVQRIMKYPLLLSQLIDATPEDHPDLESLRIALQRLTDLNTRINEAKKQAELVEQALTRKRKESDVRNGISKALGRRTEKLKQHVGMSEMFEDREYNALKSAFLENSSHLVVVTRDIHIYEEAIESWVLKMCDLAAAGDAWADISQTRHTEAESKLRQFAILVRRIQTIALPDHLGKVRRTVTEPMEKAFKMFETLANDPKGLLQKRDKRLIDYARYKNMKDRGEKLDRKTVERMEQWEALNTEAKVRIRKLLSLTGQLAQGAQENYVRLHMAWLEMCKRKFSAAMAIPLDKLDMMDIEREWQEDFDFQQATALSLSICNGSLLADAVNMVNFMTPSSTLNGEDSPRQFSWTNGNKRSISIHSDGSQAFAMDTGPRSSGSLTASPLAGVLPEVGAPTSGNSRLRAASTTAAHPPPPEISFRGHSLSAQYGSTRPGTSPAQGFESNSGPPRVSVDAPSPLLGTLRSDSPLARPSSTSTFFSASGLPSQAVPGGFRGESVGVFSSAMPMSNSPSVMEPPGTNDQNQLYDVLFTAASVYEFNIDRSRREAGFPYLTYVAGEIFDVIGERGELWLARNQDDPHKEIGWIWNKHFAKLAE